MRQRGAGRSFDVFLGNSRAPIGDVVAQGVIEQHRFLRHYPNLPAQRCERHLAYIAAVDQRASGGDIKKSRDQMHQGAFAGAARTHHRQHFSRLHFQVDVPQNLPRVVPAAVIREADVFQSDALGKFPQGRCAGFVTDRVFGIHELEDF